MVYGHGKHFGLGILHLYDTQGFLHLTAILKFTSSVNTTGTFLLHSYEALQVELGLPGKLFHYDFKEWSHVMPCWLSQTWQFASKQQLKITTNIPSLAPQCKNDQFLMLKFWQHGYKGNQLEVLNKCRLWLQATTLADITDGQGREMLLPMLTGTNKIALPTRWQWPQQGRPSHKGWILWQEAITKCIPTYSNKLTYPLGMWTDSISDWHWQWNPLENRLAESMEKGWRIWLPQQNNRGNRLRCQPTELYTALNPHFECAVVELHNHKFFSGAAEPDNPYNNSRARILLLQLIPWNMHTGHLHHTKLQITANRSQVPYCMELVRR